MKLKLSKPKRPTKRQTTRFIYYCIIILLGNAMAAAGSEFLIIPQGFAMGGSTGLGIFVRNVLIKYDVDANIISWAVSISTYAINISLFILGSFLLGKKFAVTTLAGTLLYPTCLAIFNLVPHFELSDPMLAAILGALMFGFGVGIVVRVGASTGGSDIPPLILHKYFNIPVSASLYVLDMSIVAIQFFVIPLEKVLYGVVIALLSSYIVDKVAPIGMKRMQVKIISKKHEEIRNVILKKISRGVTVLYGETGYLRNDCRMLLTVVSRRQLVQLKTEVQKIDPEAFMTISVVSEVRGRGFHTDGVDFLLRQERDADLVALPEQTDKKD